jgi:hypothetical protein
VSNGVDLQDVLKDIQKREKTLGADFERYPQPLLDKLNAIGEILPLIKDIHILYKEPLGSWAITMHVLKFVASVFFSRGNEEHGFPLGGGDNGKSFLLYVLDRLLGGYACGVQAGMYSQPVPSPKTPNPEWLALMGKKVFLGGEKGGETKIDAGTFKALRDPTNTIELRGLWEGTVKFKSAGRLILPDNSKVEFKGGIDGGVRRSTLAWPHPWTFRTKVDDPSYQQQSREIKNKEYVDPLIPGLLLFLMEVDNVWGAEWISGQIQPQPHLVKEASCSLLTGRLDSNLEDFFEAFCCLTNDMNEGVTPAKLMAMMRSCDNELRGERELEALLRAKWYFVSPQNRHRIRPSRESKQFIALQPK